MSIPRAVLDRLFDGGTISAEDGYALIGSLLDDGCPPALVGAVLAESRKAMKSGSALSGMAHAMLERAILIDGIPDDCVDTCGTGGGHSTFNISTGVAIVASACGARVAKHGNRAVTSSSGSADVLEALGLKLDQKPDAIRERLQTDRAAFLFAPHFHPSLKNVAAVRKSLPFRTVFNVLGPLCNPARTKTQLIGVYSKELTKPIADAYLELGGERAWVVWGEPGLDEVSACGVTHVAEVKDGTVSEFAIEPMEFGLPLVSMAGLEGAGTPKMAAKLLNRAVSGDDEERSLALIPGVASVLYLSGQVDNVQQGADRARECIESGVAAKHLAAITSRT